MDKSSSRGNSSATAAMSLLSLDIDRENVTNLKLRAELVDMLSDEISLTIANFKKQSFLTYLLAATCPLSEGRTDEMRLKELRSIITTSKIEYQTILQQSLIKVERVKSECALIAKERDEFLQRLTVQKSIEAESHRLDQYLSIFESLAKSAKENYDKVTSEYLILRHNGTVLQDLLNERFTEAESTYKKKLQNLELFESEISSKIDGTKLMYDCELEALVHQMRQDVVYLETETRELEVQLEHETAYRKQAKRALKQELKAYKQNYNRLQEKRRFELENVRAELTQLREMIQLVQEQMFSKYRTPGLQDPDLTSVTFTLPTSKSKIKGLKKVVSDHDIDLQFQLDSIRRVLSKAL